MKAKLSLLILLCCLVVIISAAMVSCKKESFNTKPTLKFKSLNKTSFFKGELVDIKLQVTDKEGDLSETDLYWEKVSLKGCVNLKGKFKMPTFPETKNLDAELGFPVYYDHAPQGVQYPAFTGCIFNTNDSAYFKFCVKDKAGNLSDTVFTDIFILLKD